VTKKIFKECSILGLGRIFHLHHYKNIKKNNFKIVNIFDPRKKLLNMVKQKLNIKKVYYDISDFKKNCKTKYYFFFLPRDVSFFFLNKILDKKNIVIFIEKPVVQNINNFEKILIKAKKNKNKIFVGYMFRYSEILKKFICSYKTINKKNIKKITAEMSLNYNLHLKSKNIFKEKISKKYNEKKLSVDYKIFLNRYSHLLNLIFLIFNKVKFIKSNRKDYYNYNILLKKRNFNINIDLNNKKNYFLQILIYQKNCKKIALKYDFKNDYFYSSFLDENYKKKIKKKENLYFQEINVFSKISQVNLKKQYDDFRECLKISKLCVSSKN
jgi:hypothetical protein